MKVTKGIPLVNDIFKEQLGETGVVKEDLSDFVDKGKEYLDAINGDVEIFTGTIADKVGKTEVYNRPYEGVVPSLLVDSWEFGSALERIEVEMPEATEDASQELIDGMSYDPFVFHASQVNVKMFNSKVAWGTEVTIPSDQVKSAFNSAQKMNAFVSSILSGANQSINTRLEGLIRAALNNMTAMTLWDAFGKKTAEATDTSIRAVNLLKLYKDEVDPTSTLTATQARSDAEFLRFAVSTMTSYASDMRALSTMFNMGGRPRHTSKDYLGFVMLADFKAKIGTNLLVDAYHKELLELPESETLPFWQGFGDKSRSFEDKSKIHVVTAREAGELAGHEVELDGIVAVMYDKEAVMVANQERYVDSIYNPKNRTTNFFYKQHATYINDPNYNFVTFFIK